MENNKFKEVRIKYRTCCYFDEIIQLAEFHIDSILIDEKSYKIILIYDITYENLIDPNLLRVRLDKLIY